MTKEKKSGLGAAGALVATVAAAAGAYFLYGTKEGKKTQKKIKGWALKAKGEVLEKLEKAKTVSEDTYKAAVSDVMKKYQKLKKEHGTEVEAVSKELHGYWKELKKHLNTESKKARR